MNDLNKNINSDNSSEDDDQDLFKSLYSDNDFNNLELDSADGNPFLFTEKFDKNEVINKPEKKAGDKNQKDLDIESFLTYDKESYKNSKFKNLADKPQPDENENLDGRFQDFLILPKISGKVSNLPHGHKIPSENITTVHGTVEIADYPISDLKKDENISSVFINRDKQGEIVSVEVLCKCGERTKIEFQYKDTLNSSPDDDEKS